MMKRGTVLGVFFLLTLAVGAQQFASELQMSTENIVYWYRICNAFSGNYDYVMTDCSSQDSIYQVQLLQTEVDDEYSQWKLTAFGNSGKVVLTNRATGLMLGGKSLNLGNHNSTKLITDNTQGYSITSLGDNTFSLQGVEDDGVERCLALAEKDAPASLWPNDNLSASVIGWKFILVESKVTGIFDVKNIAINVVGKRVFVSGCPNWQLFNLHGKELSHAKILSAGVYLVKTPDVAVKVMIP